MTEDRRKARLAAKRAKRRAKRRQQDAAKLAAAGVTPMGRPSPDYVRDDGFYKSSSWRTLRYAALKNCGGRCPLPSCFESLSEIF